MNRIETTTDISPVLSTAELCVGGRVLLLKDIWDDGEDHHPPGFIARAGEVLIVRRVNNIGARRSISVSHEHVNDNSFTVYAGEYETHNAKTVGITGIIGESHEMS